MAKSILQKLHEDEEARKSFHNILLFLQQASTPCEDLTEDLDCLELEFMSHIDALAQLQRLPVQEGDTKIGHWCSRESEKVFNGLPNWPLYWLTISLAMGLPIHPTHPDKVLAVPVRYTEIDLSLWAEGYDDNTIQKGIKAWVGVHFPVWEVKSLKCVRR